MARTALQLDLLICPFNSGDGEALARCGWYIYVSLHLLRPAAPVFRRYLTISYVILRFQLGVLYDTLL